MENDAPKKSKKKLWSAIGLGALAVLGIGAMGSSEPAAITNTYEAVEVAPLHQVETAEVDTRALPEVQQQTEEKAGAPSAGLSNDNYYTNVDGNQVHSPAYSDSSCKAVGASAE